MNTMITLPRLKTVRRTMLVFAFSFLAVVGVLTNYSSALAQTIPQHPNKTNAEGKREGTWTILYDKNWTVIDQPDSAAFYRLITYENGKPKGMVRDYYRSGQVQMEAKLLADNPDIMDSLATWYDENGNINDYAFYKDSLKNDEKTVYYLEELLKMQEKRVGKESMEYATTLSFLVGFYKYGVMENHKKAEQYGLQRIKIIEKILGKETREYIWGLRSLSLLYTGESSVLDFIKAEAFANEAVNLSTKVFGKKHLEYAASLTSLGNIYTTMANHSKALPILLEALEIQEGIDTTSIWYANSLFSVIYAYYSIGNYSQAERLFEKLMTVYKNEYNQAQINYIQHTIFAIKGIYINTNRYAKAKLLYKQIQEGYEKMKKELFVRFRIENFLYLTYYADLYQKIGEKEIVDTLLIEIENSYTKINNFDKPFYAINLCRLYEQKKSNFNKAKLYYAYLNKWQNEDIKNVFITLSESEKEAFYNKFFKENFRSFNSFVLQAHTQFPELRSEMYNLQLATKALLLNSTAKWKQRIVGSGDRKLRSLFDDWEQKRQQFAKFSQMSIEDQKKQGVKLDSLEAQINGLEKVLSQRSELFASLADRKQYTWKDVQAKLKQGESAIEIIRVNKYGVQKVVTDSSAVDKDSVYTYPKYPLYGLTDTVYYAALIVTPQTKTHPDMVLLTNGNDLEGKYLKQYSQAMKYKLEDKNGYTQFWQKIWQKLNSLYAKTPSPSGRAGVTVATVGLKKVYFSPDGVYHQINLNTLKNPQTGKYIIDEIQVIPVTNTKDLVLQKKEESANTYALLFGSPDYQLDETSREKKVKALNENVVKSSYLLGTERGGMSLAPLPSTKIEVENISKLLQAKGYTPQVYLEGDALEENLKNSFKPSILHIATHGFFQPTNPSSPTQTLPQGEGLKNPLLRSGLMLAGAGHSLANQRPMTVEEIISGKERIEDGILTAYEAMNLNLDNTELVVLSACETGLGEVMNGEGVYGLQRAFKVAGAKSILMSLWKVDDKTTQELMTLFYEYWLAGNSKQAAFKMAQMKLREKYKMPYYWGCFVMVGE